MSRHEKRGRIFSTMLDLDALFNGLKSSKNKSHAQNIPTSTMQHETPPFETVSDQLVTFAKKILSNLSLVSKYKMQRCIENELI